MSTANQSPTPDRPRASRTGGRARMTGAQRREQLLAIGRRLFAEKGFEGTSVEEIAATAGVSKPVVYEHFGGKEGLYSAVVELETAKLLEAITEALTQPAPPRQVLEIAAMTLLDYIETETDGFRILVRDSPITKQDGGFASLMSDVAGHVEYILGEQFAARGFDPEMAPLYAQMLVGMIAMTGQFWLDHRKPEKAVVAAHVVNLAWNGLTGLETRPRLRSIPKGDVRRG
ncbi:TetR/AcrR family transcriptional regulator [Kineosporia succinea]|uniref:AcrR family transcriptional regulator n=1 Tax=Kineosporia succinea TaxID=84632 RepID=A0ABT9NYV2_9ACTN|nr:TetR/AcrR family transcriptional regulator [Kineosporia succinea]MDP9825611.1 AcrR family transcriptional regulator [Kineosporia succinea]